MKAKLASKSVISILLALLMVVSMMTIGIVSATSAKVEVAGEGASVMEVYFTKPNDWGSAKLHYWGGATSSSWPGIDMTYSYTNDYGQAVYYNTIPADTTGIIFNNGSGTQTADLNVAGKQVVAYYWNGSAAVSWDDIPAPAGSGETTPTAEPVTGETTRLAIADETTLRWLGNDDAQFYVVVNNAKTLMTKSVDVASGLKTWYADVAKINGGTAIEFDRVSAIDDTKVFNKFSTSYTAGSPLYVVSGDGNTITASTMLDMPDGSATNFGYGIWVDTTGEGDTKNFVKIYAGDFKSDTTYHLYLPSFVDTTALKMYTNFPSLTVNGTSVTKGQVNTLNIPLTNNEKNVSISFKRNATGSTHTGTLHIMKSTASSMFMTTKMELYTGLAAAYGENSDGSANYEGVAAYKETVNTKGDYLFYDAKGKVLNSKDKTTGELLTGLKKIKGRGNSSFEASMRLYGKYAYNVTLNDKAKLIDGCESSKKYCLLANNADESLMRNTTIFGIADEIGLKYTPNTRLIDLYDNGNYLGAYSIVEKVEYGKSTLIPDANSLDKTNEDILAAGKGIDYDALKQRQATYTAKSGTKYTYSYSYTAETGKTYEFDGSTVTIGEGEDAETYTLDETYMKTHDFLFEHEITSRYDAEATWFISGRTKQAVVPKYPEFATQKEVQWMIEEYDALETAAYAKNYAGVASVADVDSFAGTYLIQELTMNLDACATSYYILGGGSYDKLLAAPLWDYDWAVGAYNGKRKTVSGEVDVADYTKTYVKVKSVSTGDDGRTQSVYNLQAQLCQIGSFWNDCKRVWTNDFVPVLNNYLGDGNTLLGKTLPEFQAAAAMNESRWGVMAKNYTGAHSDNPGAATWGTRSTTTYVKGSNNFGIGSYYAPGSNRSYNNTVYYLNDWMTKRVNAMSTTMGLYDESMIETEPPTEAPTDAPTEAPTSAPTDAPTEAPTEAPETYIRGDVDGDGAVTIMDATAIQRMIAGFSVDFDEEKARICGTITGDSLNVIDATAIQRYIADYSDSYGIGDKI